MHLVGFTIEIEDDSLSQRGMIQPRTERSTVKWSFIIVMLYLV